MQPKDRHRSKSVAALPSLNEGSFRPWIGVRVVDRSMMSQLRPLLVFWIRIILTNAQTHCHKTSCQSYGNPPVFFQIIKNLILGLKSLRVDCQCLPFHLKLTEPHSLIGNCQLGQIFKTHFASRNQIFNLTNEQTKLFHLCRIYWAKKYLSIFLQGALG